MAIGTLTEKHELMLDGFPTRRLWINPSRSRAHTERIQLPTAHLAKEKSSLCDGCRTVVLASKTLDSVSLVLCLTDLTPVIEFAVASRIRFIKTASFATSFGCRGRMIMSWWFGTSHRPFPPRVYFK